MPDGSAVLDVVGPAGETIDRGVTTTAKAPTPRPDGFERFRRHYTAGFDAKWQIAVLNKLFSFYQMPADWDGNGAPPVRREAGMFALEALAQVMLPRTPLPRIVPTSVGGVQVEWHEADIDLEFHVAAPYHCELWFEDHTGQYAPVSAELAGDFAQLGPQWRR